jgi:hypothetical protein
MKSVIVFRIVVGARMRFIITMKSIIPFNDHIGLPIHDMMAIEYRMVNIVLHVVQSL